jgi:Zn-dependent protease
MTNLRGYKIAKIRGVDITIHFSLIFLLFYVILAASAQFPLVVKQSGLDASKVTGTASIWSIIFAIGLFFSVLLHEFGHVIVAQSLGVKVKAVTLMMLGGVSSMEKMPERPYAEFKVSIVGPLVSFGIAGFLFGLLNVTASVDVALFCYWLSRVNLVIGIFNLIPALPLDGGRALRSILAVSKGGTKATETSVRIAKGISWGLGLIGLFGFNLLLMLIAVFIYSAANQESLFSRNKDLLRGLRARDVVRRVGQIPERETVESAAEEMLRFKDRVLVVLTHSEPRTVLRLDFLKRIPRGQWSQVRVSEVMEKPSRTMNINDLLEQALPELMSGGIIMVQDEEKIAGVIEYRDLAEVIDFRNLDTSVQQKKAA